MVRVSAGPHRKAKHKKVLKSASGYRGRASKAYRIAKQAVVRAAQYSYIHRRKRAADFRRLWIMRVNAAVRERGTKYSIFLGKLNKGINLGKLDEINRKSLSQLAILDAKAFDEIFKKVMSI